MSEDRILLDPTGEQRPATRDRVPRLESIAGRTVALLDISKARGDVFLDRIEEKLRGAGVAVLVPRSAGAASMGQPRDPKTPPPPAAPWQAGQPMRSATRAPACAVSSWGGNSMDFTAGPNTHTCSASSARTTT